MMHIWELKTTSEDCSPGSFYWKRLTLDNQVSMYVSAMREQGKDVAGVLYDVIRKSGLRPLGKGTETPESYEQRILDQIADEPSRYYQRGIVVRTADEIAEHDADVWQIAELIRNARNAKRWPRYVGACANYGSVCEYWPACSGEATIDDSDRYEDKPATLAKTRLPVLSASALTTWRTCPRKYFYAYELRRRAKGTESTALYFGKLIHGSARELNERGLSHAIAFCDERARSPHDAAHARALVRGYWARWADDAVRVVAHEVEFSRALRNPDTGAASRTFELGGFLDGVVESKGEVR